MVNRSPVTIQILPIELISGCFTFLELMDLVCASWVCRHWRCYALNHGNFWSDIRIDCLDPSTLFWAAQRLKWTSNRPFKLVIDYPERHSKVEKDLLDLLCAYLGSVRELHITLDSFYAISIYETLLKKAESLEKFRLHLVLGYGGELFELQDLPLPSRIFGGKSDRLQNVALENVILTNITPIPAFSKVKVVSITFGEAVHYQFPTYLFDYFPQMNQLALSSGSISFSAKSLDSNLMERFAGLSYLDLSFSGRSTVEVFRHVETHRIPQVSLTNANDAAVYAALGPLRSPFHMFCQKVRLLDCDEVRITIWSSSTNHLRHFAENPRNYVSGSENGPLTLFENVQFAQQITSLTIATSVWSTIVPFLPPYNELTDLRVWVTEWSITPVSLPRAPLRLPKLKYLLLEGVHRVHVTAVEVLGFLESTTPNRVHLHLCNIALIGDLVSLRERTLTIPPNYRNELGHFRVQH